MRLGVVGGTFDPIHIGHIAMAEAAAACAGLDRILLVPSFSPPHRAPAIAGADERLSMCRLAAAGETLLEVSDLEVSRQGRSYTVDTLAELHRLRPADELSLVLGWDAARELETWREPARVLELARLVVIPRPGLPEPDQEALMRAGLDPLRTLLCAAHTPPVDATEVRRRLAAGEDLKGMLAPPVAEFIRRHGLYLGSTGG